MNFKIAIDCVILAYESSDQKLMVLTIKRGKEPFSGSWVLPGGFVKTTEPFQQTALKVLEKETGLNNAFLQQLQAYSLTDPREENRIASVAYYSLVNLENAAPLNKAQEARWVDLENIPELAFDHRQKVEDTISRIKKDIQHAPLVYHLLPEKFSLNNVQSFYECLFQKKLDNRNFRKQLKKLPYLEPLSEYEQEVSHRPAQLYRFNQQKYKAHQSF
jgi:8-oxo-dGTP diphosphatase